MRVLVAAGGSGGHVYPALAVLEELRNRGELSAAGWVGTPWGVERRIIGRSPWISYYILPVVGIDRRRPWRWAPAVWRSARSVRRAANIVREFRPHVVLGMGGYPAFAPCLAAKALGVPVAVHEQNVRLGLVNRLLSRLADRVLLSFAPPGGVKPGRGRVVVTGNPVRREIAQAGAAGARGRELLVVGGSQGSGPLVRAALQAAPALARCPGLRLRLLVGQAADPTQVSRELKAAGLRQAAVVRYTHRMDRALAQARLVVARAGATTVAELAAAGRPAILVPWCRAAGGHQEANAHALAQRGGCVVLPERELARVDLGALVAELWADQARLAAMARAARDPGAVEAAGRVADALCGLAKGSQ
ncbi:MAG: undecaprenyldiphospho-muramoylpentapeptide beta-N-acetylglucosaminyltransferase [Candidatus Bipolaricaulaceae bacterium]